MAKVSEIFDLYYKQYKNDKAMAMDGITKDRVMKLHPKIRNEVLIGLERVQTAGVKVRVVQGLRTFAEQDALYAQGRTRPPKNIVTYAKAGQSYHNYGLAFDFCLLHDDGSISWNLHEDMDEDRQADWMEVVNIFRNLGFEWGGTWNGKKQDNPHLEKVFGLSWEQCLALHDAGKVDSQGYILI